MEVDVLAMRATR